MWKDAIKYLNLLWQFGISVVVGFGLGEMLGRWLGVKYLSIVGMVVVGVCAFYRLIKELEKNQ